jgi:hypothetical protein
MSPSLNWIECRPPKLPLRNFWQTGLGGRLREVGVDQWQQLVRGSGVATFDPRQNLRDAGNESGLPYWQVGSPDYSRVAEG